MSSLNQITGTAPTPARRRTRRRAHKGITVWVCLALLCAGLGVLLGLPISRLVGTAVSDEGAAAAMHDAVSGNTTPFTNTIFLGVLVGLAGTFIGFISAYAQVFIQFRGKRLLHWITLLPSISPPFAAATAIITLYGKRGIITHDILGLSVDVYGLPGLTAVLAMTFAPLAYLNIRGMFENLDPSTFEAASTLGASQLLTLFKVTIPMVRPALLASFLILFVEAISDLANPLVLGGSFRVLASQIYFAVVGTGDIAKAAGIAIVLLIPALGVFVVQKYWAGRKQVVTVTGKPTGVIKPVRARSVTMPIYALNVIWGVFVVLIYAAILIGGFVQILGVNNEFTLKHFEFVRNLGSDAVIKTLVMTLIAAPIGTLIALVLAWLAVRHFPRFGRLLDFVGMLGIAVPGTVLGLGFALAFGKPTWLFGLQVIPPLAGGLAVGGGVIAIIMVYIALGVPNGQQAAMGALAQINPQVEEASTSLGAGALTTFRKVTLPLIAPAIVTGMTFAITRAMTNVTAIIFLTTPSSQVMTVQILDEVDAGRFGNAFAYCALLIALVLVVLGITNLVVRMLTRGRRRPSGHVEKGELAR